jgi:hypothetical protein
VLKEMFSNWFVLIFKKHFLHNFSINSDILMSLYLEGLKCKKICETSEENGVDNTASSNTEG